MEALSSAEAELASLLLILEEGWTGDDKSQLTALETAMQELQGAKSKFLRIADEA